MDALKLLVLGALIVLGMLTPATFHVGWTLGAKTVAPVVAPVDEAAIRDQGRNDMCLLFAAKAEIPAQEALTACAELVEAME